VCLLLQQSIDVNLLQGEGCVMLSLVSNGGAQQGGAHLICMPTIATHTLGVRILEDSEWSSQRPHADRLLL
jgi:hypothetical protein